MKTKLRSCGATSWNNLRSCQLAWVRVGAKARVRVRVWVRVRVIVVVPPPRTCFGPVPWGYD